MSLLYDIRKKAYPQHQPRGLLKETLCPSRRKRDLIHNTVHSCPTNLVRSSRNSAGDIIYHGWTPDDFDYPLPPKVTEYDAKHGWLTPMQKMPYPIPPAATPRERIIIDNWKADQKKIREGPLFVRRVVDINSRVNKATLGGTAGHNAFTSISTYSARYERKYRLRPNQTGKLWCMLSPSCYTLRSVTL
jgi:hypothetical protein